jgi:hypothetical protein
MHVEHCAAQACRNSPTKPSDQSRPHYAGSALHHNRHRPFESGAFPFFDRVELNTIALQKGTKTALETTRTFATLFADMDIRQRLVMAQTVDQFRSTLLQAAKELAIEQNQWRERKTSIHLSQAKEQLVSLLLRA